MRIVQYGTGCGAAHRDKEILKNKIQKTGRSVKWQTGQISVRNCETYRLPAVWGSLQRKLFFILTLLLVHRRVGLPQKFRGSKAAACFKLHL